MIDWQRVEEIFLQAIDLPASERSSYLQAACKGTPELLAEVESLLAADDESGASIDRVVQSEADQLFSAQVLVGERLGNYRILREIGQGGMGCVYLAERDDQEFHKEVAIKVVKRGMDTGEVLKRFRYERQILAGLEHPYIARLFDGGSVDGVPFLVMEYVNGMPLDAYCREKALGVQERCELFIRILEAVAYAHRNLVVHRDLKPANILVTADGTPKLLDFGVAKLLGGDPDSEQPLTGIYLPFTPAYASPEQVRGLPITTATDIYSLGTILYELLSGEVAQKINSRTPAEIEKTICQTDVVPPSLHRRGLSGDLDNIVLMAMRKEAERRYSSADQFAADLRNYLAGKPVLARQDAWLYRARKFARRNFIPVAMGSAIALSLIAGLAVSLQQTRVAREARRVAEAARVVAQAQTARAEASSRSEQRQKALADEQRDQAEQQRAIAEQRVDDIFELASDTLFDIHDAVATLPGSIPVRRTLVKTTLDYLEKLEQQAGMDDQMREALCAAYYKLALIEGNSGGASLQDFQAAETYLRKGQSLLMPAYYRRPNDPGLMLRLIEVQSTLADLMYRSGRTEQAVQAQLELLPVARRLARIMPCTLNCRTQLPVLENTVAQELVNGDPQRALEHANLGIAETRELLLKQPQESTLKQALGTVMATAAGVQRQVGNLEESSVNFRNSIQIREELLQNEPSNLTIRRNLMIAYGNYAALLGIPWSPNLDRPAEARVYATKAVDLARATVAADGADATARRDLGMSLSRRGAIDPAPDTVGESLADLQEARKLLEPIAAANPQSEEAASQIALILEYEGKRQETMGHVEDATGSYRRSVALLQPFVEQQNANATVQYLSSEESLAQLLSASDSRESALALADQALTLAKKYSSQPPQLDSKTATLAEAWSVLALVQSRSGSTGEALESAQTARKLWNSVQRTDTLSAHRRAIADVQKVLATAHP